MVTPDGDPVAGVVVTACREAPSEKDGYFGFPEPNSSAGPPDLDRELAEELRKIERRSRFRAATRREAVTDRDGRFILDGLGMGYHRIYGFREGLSISNATDRVGSAPGDPVELVAEPVTPITVCVLDLDGEPADRAMVDFDGSEDRSVAWSPERNVFVVRTGYLTITATAECERLASTPVMIEITDSPTDPVVLQLEARRGLASVYGEQFNRYAGQGAHVGRDVFAPAAIAAGTGGQQAAVFVKQVDGHAVKLGLEHKVAALA